MVHPSKRIIGEMSDELKGKKLLLGVTGSVSIYKSLDLARSLMRRGAEVKVIMSPDATKLISPTMFHWATGEEVVTEIGGEIEHVSLAEDYDALIVAPATANTISKIANGIADTSVPLTALNFIGMAKKVIVVPAMHLPMYSSPQIRENVEKLRAIGVEVVEPMIVKDLAHYPDVEYLTQYIVAYLLRGRDLSGLKVVVTAGPTREFIDPVRFISNPSSGTMGVDIANEAHFRGADVVLVHGPLSTHHRPYVKTVEVTTTAEMANEVEKLVKTGYDIVVLAGAPADFRPIRTAESKIDSHTEVPEIKLEKTPKISSVIRKYNVFLVGFAAETANSDDELIMKAKQKKERHKFDLIIANNARRKDIAFSSEYNEVFIIGSDDKVEKLDKNYKTIIARYLLDKIKEEYTVRKTQ
ncbi:bifunctional phosphopantothenoylcysteine decarboxylase/phosphopantothenate--cysteine ligase CoaBC [Stygiolobus caldivivus]|uniref:Coenzyme A biosynthesis bifunctional protein CoaBC n=1 Tax=Stygiolobus caldivivus TaxID=2824673 RepID=A0A8D5U7D3_9CREN|nr:bifunctional phosphopantothenoylcysteine decarboxylase/phosphopantothenate--cysteine ligase CoaBC [Stygiolobus caldivivus]BCU70415.1 phosphopantothenoylcysteine decarboxylase [Stygiolobus caldivivus]